jgi:hypothetical protein
MYKQGLLIAALVFCSSFTSSSEIENKVIKAAQDNLAASLSKIPGGKETLYGFSSRDEFKSCSIGKPYRVITLNNTFYNDEAVLAEKNYIIEQDEWRVPVVVNGEDRLLLTVTGESETFNVVDLGGMQLAKELQQKSEKFNLSESRYILRIYPLASDFLVKSTPGLLTNARYIPLTSASMGIETIKEDSRNEYSLSEVLQLIKQELKNQSKN